MTVPLRAPWVCSGPQSANSSTFSSSTALGGLPVARRMAATQRSTSQARPRMFLSFGTPPFALLWSLQSGLAHRSPTRRPRNSGRASSAPTSTWRMSSQRWSVAGWLAACSASASRSWLTAMSGSRPAAWAAPVDVPPPPAKRSMMMSMAVSDPKRHQDELDGVAARVGNEDRLGGRAHVQVGGLAVDPLEDVEQVAGVEADPVRRALVIALDHLVALAGCQVADGERD